MAGVNGDAIAVPRERDQFAALLEMRWRIFRRGMRRKDAQVSFVLYVVGRFFVFTFAFAVGCGCGAAAYFGYTQQPALLTTLFAGVLLGWQGFSAGARHRAQRRRGRAASFSDAAANLHRAMAVRRRT